MPNQGDFRDLKTTEAGLPIIIVSVGTGASILQSLGNTELTGQLARGEAEKHVIKRLKGHVIVFGYNHPGRYVVEKLEELCLDYVVITKDPDIYQELVKKEVYVLLENATQPIAALKDAGLESASTVVVDHINDPDNMLFILSARKLQPEIRIITVVHDSQLIDTTKNAGADLVIPSSVAVGQLLALSAVTKDLVGIVFSEKIGTKEIAQFTVFQVFKAHWEETQGGCGKSTVVGVVRNEELVKNIFDPALQSARMTRS